MNAFFKNSRIFLFSIFALPTVAITATVGSYLPAFYAEAAGISLTTVGLLFFSLRLFDFFSDLGIGLAVDYNPWPRGKYRPWVILSIPVAMIGVYLMYLPNPDMISPLTLIIGGFVMYTGYTFANLSHQAWGAELYKDHRDMSLFFGFREICVIVGIMIAYLIPAIVEAQGAQGFQPKVNAIGIFLLITIPTMAIISMVSGRDLQTSGTTQSFSIENAKVVGTNRRILGIVFSKLFLFLGLIGGASLSPFLVSYHFGMEDVYARVQAVFFVTALLFVFVWIWLAKWVGETLTFTIAAAYVVLAHLSIIFVNAHPTTEMVAIHYLIIGVGFGAGPYLLRAMAGHEAQRIDESKSVNARGVVYGFISL